MSAIPETLLALGPADVEQGDLDVSVMSVHAASDGSLLVMFDLGDDTTVALRLPAHAVNWPAVVEAGRSAA